MRTKSKALNPFEITSPEDLEPEQIKELFVKSYTELNNLKNRKHTIIYGSRGNGKSMLLRFLEPKCQILDMGSTPEDYFKSYGSFIGVYIPFKEGYFNKADLLSVPEELALKLSKHLINMHVVSCFIDILMKQLSGVINSQIETLLAQKIINLLDKGKLHIEGEVSLNFTMLKEVLRREICFIDEYISHYNFPKFEVEYKGSLTDYHTFIKPFFESVWDIIPPLGDMPFYLLFDEGDRLYQFQKAYINTLIANRDHKLISVKLASKISGYDYYYTESKVLIKEIHDYNTITLDELYTHSKDTYFNKVRDIANRRLDLNSFTATIDQFLPESDSERELFEKIKLETANEWDMLPLAEKTQDKSNYVNKYATARLFQYLAKKKIKKRYSGFNNIVHFSSGILRNFLYPCDKMFNKALDKGHDFLKHQYIPEPVQDAIVYEYSDNLYNEIDEALKGLDPAKASEKEKIEIINDLKALIDNLGELYYKKLTYETSRDPRIISFALRDKPSERLDKVLRYAVKEAFLHKAYSSSKAGGGRFDTYILNRGLCPRYKIDLSSLRGRIIVKSEVVEQLLNSPESAKKAILKTVSSTRKSKKQHDLFADQIITEEDEVNE